VVSGLEFVDEDTFYPRYGPPNKKEWLTEYNNGPGNYKISNEILTFSYQNTNYEYVLHFIDESKIEILNNSTENPWTGKWTLVRDK
jgi:hypothetical protein